MTLARDWRLYTALALNRKLTRKEARKVDTLRRAGWKSADITATIVADSLDHERRTS